MYRLLPPRGYPVRVSLDIGEAEMGTKNASELSNLAVVGVDIGKDTFHLVGFDTDGQLVLRRKIKRLALSQTFEKLPRCIVGWKRV